jgi:mono/diheme cytochrome c family protein/cytochrome c5
VKPVVTLGLLPLLALACSGVVLRETASGPHGQAGGAPAPTAPAPPPAAPAGSPGPDIVRNDCLACHSEDLLLQQRLARAQWAKTLEKMHTWGAPTEPENIEALTTYLASVYGPDAGPFAPDSLTAEKAAALFKPLHEAGLAGGDRERGLALYGDQCLPCHEEAGRGGTEGVALAGRRIIDHPAEFASVVRAGRGRMPDFSATTDAEVADLLAYLRSLE